MNRMSISHPHCPRCGTHPDELHDAEPSPMVQRIDAAGHLVTSSVDGQSLYFCPCGWSGGKQRGVEAVISLAEDGGILADELRSRSDREISRQRFERWEGEPPQYHQDRRDLPAGREGAIEYLPRRRSRWAVN